MIVLAGEIKTGDKVVAVEAAPVMVGREQLGQVPAGTELTAGSVQGRWIGIVWQQDGEEVHGWVLDSNVVTKAEFARRAEVAKALDTYPRAKRLTGFTAHPQSSANTCSAAAARNVLGHVAGKAPPEAALFREIVEEDHKGLAYLEGALKLLGVYNPRALSQYGGTPIGVKAVVNKRLPRGLACEYKEIPRLDDRMLVIVESINHGWPVVVPVVSSSLTHWITITGYDRDARRFSTASFGTLTFDEFDTLNSWTTMPGGQLGLAFKLANQQHMGRHVLVYLAKEEATP